MMIESDDEPLSLAEACRLIFHDKISPSTLRAEARRGKLRIERIGRQDFVTRARIREMRKLCEIGPSRPSPPSPARGHEDPAVGDSEETRQAFEALLHTLDAMGEKFDEQAKQKRQERLAATQKNAPPATKGKGR